MPTPEQLAADAEQDMAYGVTVSGLAELVARMSELKARLDFLEEDRKHVQREYDVYRKTTIPEKMREAGVTSARFFAGTLSLRSKTYPRVAKGRRLEGIDWFYNSHPEVLTFQQAPLQEVVNDLVEGGQPVPDFIEMYTEEMAVLTAPRGVKR